MVFLRQFGERTSFLFIPVTGWETLQITGHKLQRDAHLRERKQFKEELTTLWRLATLLAQRGHNERQFGEIRSVVALDETCLRLGFVLHSLSLSHLHFSMIVFRFNRPLLSGKKRPACLEKSLPILFSVGLSSVLSHRRKEQVSQFRTLCHYHHTLPASPY